MMPDHEDLLDDDETSSDETSTSSDLDFFVRNQPEDFANEDE